MAIFRIDEFDGVPTGQNPVTRLLKSKNYTMPAASDVFQSTTTYVEVMADADCYFEEGLSVAAADAANSASQMLFGGTYRPVYPSSSGHNIAVVAK